MITNIYCIKNVGKFENCNSGNITLIDKVLIFGKNMHGKSTLTSIFSSLKDGNNDLIIGRKTFGSKEEQHVVIKIDGGNFIFKDGSWNKEYGNLEIFDTKFISENICNTEEIVFEQQKNLNGVILGKEGIVLIDDINNLTENITDLSNKKRDLTNNYLNPILSNKISSKEFIKLERIEGIDGKLGKQIKLVEQVKNKKQIVEKIKKSFFRLDLEGLERIFTKKITVDFKDIERHLTENFDDITKGKKFLQEGISLLKKSRCIFCGQSFDESAKKLIGCYKKVFSEKVEDLQKEINSNVDKFNSLSFDDKIKNEILEFKNLGLQVPLSDEEKDNLIESKMIIDTVLKEKKENISKGIDLEKNANWSNIKEKFSEILTFLDTKEKEFVIHKDISKIEEELEKLQFTKKRFEQEVMNKIREYNSYDADIKRFQKQREIKQKELEEYAKGVFDKYKEKINSFLEQMNANFAIEDFSNLKKITGKDESLFCINFDNCHKVEIYEEDNCKPNFKNTLGESDKRTLAFAFFLARLCNDNELDRKIVVFDDPISSFDKERKKKTCRLLLDTNCDGKKPKQIIVLTHQEDFMKGLMRDLDIMECKYLSLKINSGQIEVIQSVSKEFPDDEIIDLLDKLYQILEKEDFETDFSISCRKVLENIMKRKYYNKLRETINSNSRASIRTFAEIIYDNKGGDFYKDFIRLCDDLQVPLHDNSVPENSEGNKKTILKDFFKILEKI